MVKFFESRWHTPGEDVDDFEGATDLALVQFTGSDPFECCGVDSGLEDSVVCLRPVDKTNNFAFFIYCILMGDSSEGDVGVESSSKCDQ